ncbi:hypothetical protein A3Q56_07246, partial [Intoshia linei]
MTSKTYKISLCGIGGVGKSAITKRFKYNTYDEEYIPTTADSYERKLNVNGTDCFLEILDTAGQEDHESLKDPYIRNSEGFILVYAVDDKESLDRLNSIYEQIKRIKCPTDNTIQPPICIAANKSDKEEFRFLLSEDGRKMAENFDTKFMECSAKNDNNINQVVYF